MRLFPLLLLVVLLMGAKCFDSTATVNTNGKTPLDSNVQPSDGDAGSRGESTVDLTSDFTPPTEAGDGPPDRPGSSPSQKHYGPWNTRVLLARSDDGIHWTRSNTAITSQADVPDMVVDSQGWVYLYYTGWTVGNRSNQTVVAISMDNGDSWIYKYLELDGFTQQMSSPVDPDIVLLEDGTFRLYLTSDLNDGGGSRTYYAEGSDGIHFEQKGVAFGDADTHPIDPTALKVGDTWHLFAGLAPDGSWHGTSQDGTQFDLIGTEPMRLDNEQYVMGNGIQTQDGEYRFYVFSNRNADIRYVTTNDGMKWQGGSESIFTVDPSNGLEADFVKDPAVVQLPNGSYLMAYVASIPED